MIQVALSQKTTDGLDDDGGNIAVMLDCAGSVIVQGAELCGWIRQRGDGAVDCDDTGARTLAVRLVTLSSVIVPMVLTTMGMGKQTAMISYVPS